MPIDIEGVPVSTWSEIKELANSLSEEQLAQPVRWWGTEDGGKINDANVLVEEYVSDGVSYAPRSEMNPASIDGTEPVVPAGTVMLWIL